MMHPVEIARRRRMLSRFAPPPPWEGKDHTGLRATAHLHTIADRLDLARRYDRRADLAAWCEQLLRVAPLVVEELTGEPAAPTVQHQIGLEPGTELERLAECLDEAHTRIAELEAELAAARLAPWETPVGPPIGPAPTGEEVSSDG